MNQPLLSPSERRPHVRQANRNCFRDRLVFFLEERGIETRYLLPLINQPVYVEAFGDLEPRFPVAARLNRSAFYIGCHPFLARSDLVYVVEQFHEFYRRDATRTS